MKNDKLDKKAGIIVRRPDFGLQAEGSRHWFSGNAILTHLFNAMHTVFPVGERQFIKTVRVYEPAITDERLKAEVKAFIGQEVQHGKQHDIFLQAFDKMGLDASGYAQWYGRAAFKMNDEKHSAEAFWIPLLKPFFSEGAEDRVMLAFTAALEHLTATLAGVILKDETILEGMPENMQNLFVWHAVEEIEHKAVAFDVFTDVARGSYVERMTGFVFAMYYLNYFLARGFLHFVGRDDQVKLLDLPAALGEALPRLSKVLAGLAVGLLPYAKPDFHPHDIDQRELAANALGHLTLRKEKTS